MIRQRNVTILRQDSLIVFSISRADVATQLRSRLRKSLIRRPYLRAIENRDEESGERSRHPSQGNRRYPLDLVEHPEPGGVGDGASAEGRRPQLNGKEKS